MGVRRRIFELVNSKMPSWGSARLRYEGIVNVMDTNLTGTVRFAKKLGQPLPVWVVDTSTTTIAASYPSSTYLDVVANSWFQPGSRLRLAGRYDVYVSDISGDGSRVHLQAPLGASFDAGTEVTLWDVPVTVSGTYAGPVTQFVLHSLYGIYRGDSIVFDSFHELEVASAVLSNTTPEGLGVYLVTLTEPYALTLTEGLVLGLRAFPAYASPKMLAPYRQPFVYDRVSGVFYEDMDDIREVDTVTLHDDFGTPIVTMDGYKNMPVIRSSVPVDMLLFGKRMEGTVKWDATKSAVVFIPGDRGRAYLRYPVAPSWPTGEITSWTLEVEATAAAKFSITLAPGNKVLVPVDASGVYTITVPMPASAVTEIQIKVFADPGVEVRLRSWSATGTAARMISHTTVARVSGPWLWGSTGALSKRNLRLDDVLLTADDSGVLTSGFFMG